MQALLFTFQVKLDVYSQVKIGLLMWMQFCLIKEFQEKWHYKAKACLYT